ncbi:MAG TPA: hypothetical protein DEA28_00265 [Firmicutes bacterium]|nr:hypothetical protein [Bacillota bacterium]
MNYINILSDGFNTPEGIDTLIINFFNNLGWWGNLILIMLSLILATIFGGILGYQREVSGHAAGFRTHILISLGSALIMIISIYGIPGNSNRDPMRLAAAGVTGIGFLGAGSIIKNGVSIKGLTTAASIWVTMAIGMAAGSGYFVISLFTVIISILCLVSFQKFETWFSKNNTNILIVIEEDKPLMKELISLLDKYDISYKSFDTSITDLENKKVLRVVFKCTDKKDGSIQAFIEEFKENVKPISISILK